MDPITQELKQHYSRKFAEFGATAKGVDWNREEDVELRYEKMLEMINPATTFANGQISLLDVGYGYGGLYWYAKEEKQLKLRYTGIDVAENMIDYAASKASDASFLCQDIFDFCPENRFDYVVCNGILTQRLSASMKDMDKFAHRLIRKMFELCRTGVAFNVMTTKVNYFDNSLYYRCPSELLSLCIGEITRYFQPDHSYPLYEYTMYLFQEPK